MKRILYEVSIIRPFVIFLLVLMHSFTMYGGGWDLPVGIHNVRAYYWVAKFSNGFMLETFILIAGYIFAYQTKILKRKYNFSSFIKKKFMRLIIPSIFFSLIYFFIFNYNPETFHFSKFIIQLLSGVGHMWFLPMLFWGYVLLWVIDNYDFSSLRLLILLAIISMIPIPFIPFGISRILHYSFYVMFGYVLYEKQDVFMRYMNKNKAILISILYILFVIIEHQFIKPVYVSESPLYLRGIVLLTSNFFSFLSSVIGIVALYYVVMKYITKYDTVQKKWIIGLSGISYGVYIYHQFILKYLYYNTSLPQLLGTYLLPWAGFVISLSLSIVFTRITLKSKAGRFLIG